MTRAEEYLIERIKYLEEQLAIEKSNKNVCFQMLDKGLDGEYKIIFKNGNVEIIILKENKE